MTITAFADKLTYRTFIRNDKLIVEFDAIVSNHEDDTHDEVVKQLIVTDDLTLNITQINEAIQEKLVEYEQSFEGE